MSNKTILQVEHLSKYFPLKTSLLATLKGEEERYLKAVDNISFKIKEKEILGFVGESGCGKSTMSRTLLRLIEPTRGSVFFNNTDVTTLGRKDLKKMRRKMQMIFQDPHGSLNPRRSVSDILRQTVQIHKLAETVEQENQMIRTTMEEVELDPDRYWDRSPLLLSGGQRQRVGIGRVLILQPKLIVADEPISMLDVSVRIGLLDLLLKMRDKHGISFIYISHDLATARYICDRIAIMYLGKIVEIGSTEEILQNPIHPYTKALIAAVPITDPTVKIKDIPIKGFVPMTPDSSLSCCSFSPRCIYSKESCMTQNPNLLEFEPGHFARCSGHPDS